jgi:ribose transport system permease protein
MIKFSKFFRQIFSSGEIVALIIYLFILFLYAMLQQNFSASIFIGQLSSSLPLALAAAGGTLVVLTRGFDLSVAGVISLSSVIASTYSFDGVSGAYIAILFVSALGLTVGMLNGFLVAYLRLQSIACTLATMIITGGIALLIQDSPGGYVPDALANLPFGEVMAVPAPILILALLLCGWEVIKRTNWGTNLFAVGADETAALLAGVRVPRVKFWAYAFAGVFYALAGLILSGISSSGDPNAGNSFLLLVFAAIAIGGTSFGGGRGSVTGSVIGALALLMVQKVLFSMGVGSFYTGIGQGLLMIVAVLIGTMSAYFSKDSKS